MRIEKLSKGRKKKVILVITILVLLIGIIYITNSKAKYQVTSNVQIVKGKVSYSLADFNLIAIYLQESDGAVGGLEGQYKKAVNGQVPTEGYTLRDLGDGNYDSYCVVDGIKNNNGITIDYKDDGINFTGIKKQGTKCYLYFDVINRDPNKTLEKLELNSQGDIGAITGPSCDGEAGSTCYLGGRDNKKNNMAQNGVYSAEDDFGISYVFRGAVNNNWLKFGQEGGEDLWWRIIRINGNGTIRLIYSGKGSSPSTTGTGTQINNSAFNSNADDNTYFGFMYGLAKQDTYNLTHQNNNKSKIMTELETWYKKTNLDILSSKIDVETGFCNDRQTSVAAHENYGMDGWGTQPTAYAPYDRLLQSGATVADTIQRPTLKCGYKNGSTDKASQKRDLFTGPNAKGIEGKNGKVEGNGMLEYPVGLITSDEVVYAGGFVYQYNNKFWLCNIENYWTMSPSYFGNLLASIFSVLSNGSLSTGGLSGPNTGVRPVINLKSDTKIEFQDPDGGNKGTTS